jgi:hypothetical protein
VGRIERGEAASVTGRALEQLVACLDARLDIRVLWHGEGLDRLLDAAHARLVEAVLVALRACGWTAVPEVTFQFGHERGSIDVLAWHPAEAILLVIEVKSVVPDIQSMLAGLDRKARLAPRIAAERGWRPRSISRLLVLPEDRTVRRRIAGHAATFDAVLPARSRAVRAWLRRPMGQLAGVLLLTDERRVRTRHRVGATASRTPARAPGLR